MLDVFEWLVVWLPLKPLLQAFMMTIGGGVWRLFFVLLFVAS
jgi:hypothetical protein